MPVSHNPSKTTPRRVLGDLPPKALNTPSKQTHALDSSEAMRAHSPLKHVTTLSAPLLGGKENLISSGASLHGRKRTIYEVDDAENVECAPALLAGREPAFMGVKVDLTAAAMRRHMVVPSPSGRVRRVANTAQETTTVDLFAPGSPTERDTSLEPDNQPDIENSQDTQASKESFSAFINYGACASQPTDHSQPQPPLEEAKKSRAEILRARLGLGIYKVKTNQVSKRGLDIISSWEATSSLETASASISTAVTSSAESIPQPLPSFTLSPAPQDSQPVFVKANLDPFRPIGKLTPAPVLLPTAVSSRMLHDYHMPSSPPQAVSPEQLMSPAKKEASYTTPVPKRTKLDGERSEGEDEAEEEEREDTVEERLQKRFREGDLTSSAVKGHAAKGLMELMAGKR